MIPPIKTNNLDIPESATVVSCHLRPLSEDVYRCHIAFKEAVNLFKVTLVFRERQVCQHLDFLGIQYKTGR